MIQPRTQLPDYWGGDFTLTDSDIEQIYNHFLEVERPQTAGQLARIVIANRVAAERNSIERLLIGRKVYRPMDKYETGDLLVFPSLRFAHGTVTAVRPGSNPEYGSFTVIFVETDGKNREFAAEFTPPHPLNSGETTITTGSDPDSVNQIVELFGHAVAQRITQSLQEQDNFIRLAQEWFVKELMADINIGHLHLAEAVLEMNDGGPLPPEEILPHLDLDSSVPAEVQRFSLNYGLLKDDRFDEVAPRGKVAWFLRRMEPDGVQETPERLKYTTINYDRALLSPQLLLLERELDDEWSEIPPVTVAQPVVFSLMYPHRQCGTLPLSARIRPLFPPSTSPRQKVTFQDEYSQEQIDGWVVQHRRYVYGLKAWYDQHEIPVGGFVHLKPGPEPGVVIIGYDRRNAKKEWARLATVSENRLKFELMRRSISCGYDDLLIADTDVPIAVDALRKRAESHQRSVASLLAEVFAPLATLNPQNTVHAKTLYSAINMLRRIPPGPLFAELVRYPAFQSVGDHYWRFDSSRWSEN